jgi:hypothetical protein
MTGVQSLLNHVLHTIREGNVPGPDELLEVETTLAAASQELSASELRELLSLVNEVQDAILGEQSNIRGELDRLNSERKAVRKYGQLRSHRQGQRVNRKT